MIFAGLYDEVMRELIVAVGAALFVANVYALLRRRADADRPRPDAVAPTKANRPASSQAEPVHDPDLAQAPIGRTVLYAAIGFVVMVVGIASLTA